CLARLDDCHHVCRVRCQVVQPSRLRLRQRGQETRPSRARVTAGILHPPAFEFEVRPDQRIAVVWDGVQLGARLGEAPLQPESASQLRAQYQRVGAGRGGERGPEALLADVRVVEIPELGKIHRLILWYVETARNLVPGVRTTAVATASAG